MLNDSAGDSSDQPDPAVTAQQMQMVLEVSRLLAVPTDLNLLLKRIADICCTLFDCEMASIFLHDKETDELWSLIVMNSEEIRVPRAAGIVGHSFCTNTLVHVPHPYEDPRFNPEPDRRSGITTRNLLACPMPDVDGNPLGVIEALNKRNKPFVKSDFGLIRLMAEQAAVAIQRHHLQQEALATVALRREMELARAIQNGLTPQRPPVVRGLESVGWTMAALQTGGDCFDLWQTADGRLGVLVADAAGHGLGPALMVLQARSLVRALCDIESDPHRLLGHVNHRLCQDLRNGNFVTAFLAFVSADGMVRWASAGHGPVFVRRRIGEKLVPLEPPSFPLGIESDWPAAAPGAIQLDVNGSLLLVSDGIFEAVSPKREFFEIERMIRIFDENDTLKPAELLALLRDAVGEWQGGGEPLDDQTIVIVQRAASEK